MCGGFKPGRNGKCTSNCFHEEIRQDVFRLRTLGILVAVTAAAAPIRRMLLATQDGAPILSRPLPDTALLAPEPRFRMRCWWHWGRVSCGSAARSVMSPRGV